MANRPAGAQSTPELSGAGLSDEQLREGLRAGNEATFRELYHAQATAIYNLCLRLLGNPEDAQDVTQDVFVKAYRQLPGCDASFRVRPWLYRVAVNACYDQLRARKAQGDTTPLPDELGSPRIDAIEQAELGRLLEQTLAGLSLRHRTVLLLKDVHGLSHGEIAAILSVSRGATETLLYRAREAFRRGYTALARSEPRQACDLARQAVVDSVGGGLSDRQRRRIIAHAKDCPDCRHTVETWSLGAFGLVAFLHLTPLPAALATPPFAAAIGGGVAAASGAGVGAASGAGVGAASGATAGATAGVVSTGAVVTAGAAVKATILAVAAGTLLVAGGVTAHHLASANRHAVEKVAVVGRAHTPGGARARSVAAGHTPGTSQAGTGASRGKGRAAGRAKAPGAARGASRAQSQHAAGSAAKAHGGHAASSAHGNSAHGAKSRRPLTKKPSAGKTAAAKQRPAAKKP